MAGGSAGPRFSTGLERLTHPYYTAEMHLATSDHSCRGEIPPIRTAWRCGRHPVLQIPPKWGVEMMVCGRFARVGACFGNPGRFLPGGSASQLGRLLLAA